MCQPGSRHVSMRHERAVSPGEIFGTRSEMLEGGRAPIRGPSIAAKGPVGSIVGTTGDKARGLVGGPVAAKPPTSINRMPPIAPGLNSVVAPQVRPKIDSAVAEIRQAVGPIAKPSPVQVSTGVRKQVRDLEAGSGVTSPSVMQFHGTPFQERLVSDFTAICNDAKNMPVGRENRDARKMIRTRLCFRIQNVLNLRYVDGDKKKFAGVVKNQLAQRLPPSTDIAALLPEFMKEWLEGRNLD